MHIVFRTDSASHIGLGHVSRCLTLAGSLKSQGHTITFICRLFEGHFCALIEAQGFTLITLDKAAPKATGDDCQRWLGVSEQQDASQTITALQQCERVDAVVVDNYGLSTVWHRLLRSHCNTLMVIDELCNRELDCHLLLDQTPGREADQYKELLASPTQLLCGSHYALLRDEFSCYQSINLQPLPHSGPLSLVISMGGTDPGHISETVLRKLVDVSGTLIENITVILGSEISSELSELQRLAPFNVILEHNCREMAKRYAEADLIIGAAGVSSLERCAVGALSLLYIYAENQRDIANNLASKGAAIIVTDHKHNDFSTLKSLLSQLQADPQLRHQMAQQALRVCDGLGAQRVANALIQQIQLDRTNQCSS